MEKIKIGLKNKRAISLVVLVITIIVMIILSATIVMALNNGGIIEKANDSVRKTNITTVKQLASVKWAEAYLDGKTTQSELEEYVIAELKKAGVKTQEYKITVTESGVDVEQGFEDIWETIYTGEEYTKNSFIVVSDKAVYNTAYRYRLTLESDEFSGTIEANPVLIVRNNILYYTFAIIHNKKATTFSTVEEGYGIIGSITGQYTLVAGVNDFNGKVIIGFENNTCQYKVKKLEVCKQEIYQAGWKKIYEGDAKPSFMCIQFSGLKLDVTKNYVITKDEIVMYDVSAGLFGFDVKDRITGEYLGGMHSGLSEGEYLTEMSYNAAETTQMSNIIVYETGDNPNVKQEGENVILYTNSKWTLISGSRITPKTVDGKQVTAVSLGSVYDVYYDGSVELIVHGDAIFNEFWCDLEVAPTVDPDDVFNPFIESYAAVMWAYIDMSKYDELVIPEQILSKNITIYVSEAVKANYSNAYNVQVKT